MRKRIVEMLVLASFMTVFYLTNRNTQTQCENVEQAQIIDTQIVESYKYLSHAEVFAEQEEIRNEIMYGEMELLAQLIESEAGNQDELGKRYVADVVLNRRDSSIFPDTIEDVIYQTNPVQFSVIKDGAFDRAGYTISCDSFRIAYEEYIGPRQNYQIMYFTAGEYNTSGTPAFKHGNHYFSTL